MYTLYVANVVNVLLVMQKYNIVDISKIKYFRINFLQNRKQKVDLNLLQIELGKGLGKGGFSIKSLKETGYEGIFVGIGKLFLSFT